MAKSALVTYQESCRATCSERVLQALRAAVEAARGDSTLSISTVGATAAAHREANYTPLWVIIPLVVLVVLVLCVAIAIYTRSGRTQPDTILTHPSMMPQPLSDAHLWSGHPNSPHPHQALEQQHLEEQFLQHHYFDPASRPASRNFSAHFHPQTNFTTEAMPDLNQAVRFV